MKALKCILLLLLCLAPSISNEAQARNKFLNNKVLNRPYADNRAWHLGFSVGLHTQNLIFTHNGFITEDGEEWQIDQPDYSPGFCVNGLIDFRLSTYFSVRFTPGLYFGTRNLRMIDHTTGAKERQSLKSTYIVAPIDIKYSAQRLRNIRPYLSAGVMPAFDVSKKEREFIELKQSDVYLCVGFGCDFYLPYFKLSPEIKFCFGLGDVLKHDRPDLVDDPSRFKFTQSLSRATSRMIVLTFYFE